MSRKFDELAKGLVKPVTRRQARKKFSVGLLGLTLASAAGLAQVPMTFNTGVDGLGVPLANYSVDQHFTLIASADPQFPGPDAVVVDDTLFPIATGNWIANSATSKWIAPQGDQENGDALGTYTYRTTIDLTGYDPELVQLVGQWSCDSVGIDVRINGASTGNATITNLFADAQWNPLLITTGFGPGTNTLDFLVQRVPFGGGTYLPTGLRAELVITNLPPPQLQIATTGQRVLVWWPTNAPAFGLEASAGLGANQIWSVFHAPITVISDQNVVVADTSGPSMFFRLRRR